MHVCPMVTGIVPHVGGPIITGLPTVLIGFMPAARVMDLAVCAGGPDSIAKGSMTVLIGNMPAARIGDLTVHGGTIVSGMVNVLIGDMGSGGAGAPVTPAVPPTAPGDSGGSGGSGGESPDDPGGDPSGGGGAPPPADPRRKYDHPPTLAEILDDPFVIEELERAFQESNPNAPNVPNGSPGSQKHEQGGWIVWNKDTGQLEVRRVPPGTRDGLGTIVGTRPQDNEHQQTVGWFHTHPNKSEEGFGPEPSDGDRGFQNGEAKVPGIIETHDGRRTMPFP